MNYKDSVYRVKPDHKELGSQSVYRNRDFFSNACQKMRGGKHVKVKKRRGPPWPLKC